MPAPRQPDPLSPQAQAILGAPDQPALPGPLTPALADELREAARTARGPKVAAEAQARGVNARWLDAGGVPVVCTLGPGVASEGAPARALFLHGGGFTGGMAYDMSSVLLAEALGLPVHSVDYPLAPQVQYPVPVDAIVTAFEALRAELGGPWIVLAVSAGGNLALALTQRLRAAGAELPAALGLFTPLTDLTAHGDARTANAGRDPVLRWTDDLEQYAAAYAGDTPLDDPLLSPVYASYDADFPPTIITTGTRDLLLSDCTRLYWLLRRAGATVELRVWENLWHSFNTQPDAPEGAEARGEVAEFVLGALRRPSVSPPPRPA